MVEQKHCLGGKVTGERPTRKVTLQRGRMFGKQQSVFTLNLAKLATRYL